MRTILIIADGNFLFDVDDRLVSHDFIISRLNKNVNIKSADSADFFQKIPYQRENKPIFSSVWTISVIAEKSEMR